jgi:hypothetical protein
VDLSARPPILRYQSYTTGRSYRLINPRGSTPANFEMARDWARENKGYVVVGACEHSALIFLEIGSLTFLYKLNSRRR